MPQEGIPLTLLYAGLFFQFQLFSLVLSFQGSGQILIIPVLRTQSPFNSVTLKLLLFCNSGNVRLFHN